MASAILLCFSLFAILHTACSVSTKVGFTDNDSSLVVQNTSRTEDDEVEVKHTIVLSTKLKNNNRRGVHGRGDDEAGILSYNIGKQNKEDSDEVPVIKGFKAIETTQIRTPDTRRKTQIYPDSLFVSRNIRDDYDYYPNVAHNPSQWKPSNFFNNINWWQQDGRDTFDRRNYRPIVDTGNVNRKISDDAVKEFYCKKCRELSSVQNTKGCIQQRSHPWIYETTTPKMKLDGKLAKLN